MKGFWTRVAEFARWKGVVLIIKATKFTAVRKSEHFGSKGNKIYFIGKQLKIRL